MVSFEENGSPFPLKATHWCNIKGICEQLISNVRLADVGILRHQKHKKEEKMKKKNYCTNPPCVIDHSIFKSGLQQLSLQNWPLILWPFRQLFKIKFQQWSTQQRSQIRGLYLTRNDSQIPKVPSHDGLVVIRDEEGQLVHVRSSLPRVVFHEQADAGCNAQSHLQGSIVQLHNKVTRNNFVKKQLFPPNWPQNIQ